MHRKPDFHRSGGSLQSIDPRFDGEFLISVAHETFAAFELV
jgi:hypothetical protein